MGKRGRWGGEWGSGGCVLTIMMVEIPNQIPPYRAYTINLNGMIVKKSMRAKLAWIIRVLVRKMGADIVLILDTGNAF